MILSVQYGRRFYVSGGGGFTSREATAFGAPGCRIRLGGGWILTPEFRLGTHAFPTVLAGVGYEWTL